MRQDDPESECTRQRRFFYAYHSWLPQISFAKSRLESVCYLHVPLQIARRTVRETSDGYPVGPIMSMQSRRFLSYPCKSGVKDCDALSKNSAVCIRWHTIPCTYSCFEQPASYLWVNVMGFFPYWPVFMIYGLATVYFGWQGIFLAYCLTGI
jgi:hypothetical protein